MTRWAAASNEELKFFGIRLRFRRVVGSAETTDFPKDTELELDSVGTIALEGGTSSSGVIERAVDELPGDTVGPSDLRDCHRENIRSARKMKT